MKIEKVENANIVHKRTEVLTSSNGWFGDLFLLLMVMHLGT